MNVSLTRSSEPVASDEITFFVRYQKQVRRRRSRRMRLAFVAFVAPLLLTLAFIYFVATPMYNAETRFAVRGGDAQQGGVSGILAAGNPGMALSGFVDGYAVRDFLQSRDAMDRLDAKIGLISLFSRETHDPFVRLPPDATRDALYDQYHSLVSARYNMVEQIVVVNTQAFSAADAVRLSKALIEIADGFADSLNRRALDDAVKVAQTELARAEDRTAVARANMAKWRIQNSNVDPAGDVAMLNQVITQLETQLAVAETDLKQLRDIGEQHPRRQSAEALVNAIRIKIADTRNRFAGGVSNAAERISVYEGLRAAQEFAEQSLAAARQNLSTAQQTLQRQQRFVTIVSQPVAQTRPAYPDKMTLILLSLLGGAVLAFFASFGMGVSR